jgi:hypothetical protein
MRALLLFTFGSLITACIDNGPSESSTSQSVIGENKLAANKLAANKLAANKLAANKLAANKLAANKLAANKLAVGDLIESADGREVLNYAISCALRDGDVLEATASDGTVYDFPGEIGLVPSWAHHPLTEEGKGWISACLFARVNAHDVAVPVSLRGPSHALVVTDDERAGWPLEEGAFYGNFFTPDNDPIVWVACRGRDQAAGETGGLVDRDCAEPDPADPTHTLCGFTYAGDCGDYAPPPSPTACERFSHGGFYVECKDHPAFDGHGNRDEHGDCDHRNPTFRQVITTFVTL